MSTVNTLVAGELERSPQQTLGDAPVLDEAAAGAVSTPDVTDSAARRPLKRKKIDRHKTCPECGLKASSNRQLKCRGCQYVYRISEHKPKKRLVVPEPSPVPLANSLGDDWPFEELDDFFKGFGEEILMPLDDIRVNFFDESSVQKGICV